MICYDEMPLAAKKYYMQYYMPTVLLRFAFGNELFFNNSLSTSTIKSDLIEYYGEENRNYDFDLDHTKFYSTVNEFGDVFILGKTPEIYNPTKFYFTCSATYAGMKCVVLEDSVNANTVIDAAHMFDVFYNVLRSYVDDERDSTPFAILYVVSWLMFDLFRIDITSDEYFEIAIDNVFVGTGFKENLVKIARESTIKEFIMQDMKKNCHITGSRFPSMAALDGAFRRFMIFVKEQSKGHKNDGDV